METTYTYSISATANNFVNIPQIRDEITSNSTILIALKDVMTNDTDVEFIFKDALPTAQETELTTLVSNHYGEEVTGDVQEVKIVEEGVNPNERTQGHYYCKGLSLTVPAVMGDYETTYSFPYPITMMAMEIVPVADWAGDELSVLVAPETTIGAITADVTAGDDTISVSQTVIDNMELAFYCYLDDGTNNEKVGHVKNIDKINNTLTLTGTAANSYAAATPTYVKMSVPVIDRFHITGVMPIIFGDVKIGGTYLPANTPFKFIYHNQNGLAKTFYAAVEILY